MIRGMLGKSGCGTGLLVLGLGICALGLSAAAQSTQTLTDDDQVTFRIIIVSSAERAEQLAVRGRQGEDFATLARAESLDPSAARGGLIGPIALSELRAELRDALRNLPPGEVRGVLTVPTGFALVQRVEADPVASARGAEFLTLSAVAGVKATISVDGLTDVQTAVVSLEKPADWDQDPRLICQIRQQAIDKYKMSLSRALAQESEKRSADVTLFDIIDGHASLANLHAYTGDLGLAVKEYEEAHRLALVHHPRTVPDHEQALGIAYVHKAAMENGLYTEPGDRCLLSLQSAAPLAKTDDFLAGERRLLSLL
ncbi:MAG: hypothetical protein EHM89_18510, partial [Acidobacteria bacterium]